MAYTQNVPLGNQQIATTQPIIESNFQFLQADLGVEHNFNASGSANDMYHLKASMPNIASPPSGPPAGTNGMYYVQGGEARFINNAGKVNQLTLGNNIPQGYQWIGGVLIQWGFVFETLSNNLKDVANFNIAFPTICFFVVAQPFYDSSNTPQGRATVAVASDGTFPTTSQFQWKSFTDSGDYTGFYWYAIGK